MNGSCCVNGFHTIPLIVYREKVNIRKQIRLSRTILCLTTWTIIEKHSKPQQNWPLYIILKIWKLYQREVATYFLLRSRRQPYLVSMRNFYMPSKYQNIIRTMLMICVFLLIEVYHHLLYISVLCWNRFK